MITSILNPQSSILNPQWRRDSADLPLLSPQERRHVQR